ncbi:acyltransferase family protein [Flavobacterium sp. RNTU_13]|uniref:acyltransferase family protein n=1 Tax=Flavobacterium sp. RNTU_13 TaxID=3375145 RepID=UPI0039867608
MNKLKSFYLEVLRIIASFYVFIYHVSSEDIAGKQYISSPQFTEKFGLLYAKSHCYVMVFFVLSGYLITMSGTRPNVTFKKFMVARLGRIYSVMLPAIIFSIIVSILLVNLYPQLFADIENYNFLVPRFFLNLSFLSQAYTLCATPPLETALWSVQYEVMYYVLFAVFVLYKGKWKWPLFGAIICLTFPKVLLLFPVWLLGSVLYIKEKKIKMNFIVSLVLSSVSTVLLIYYIHNVEQMPLQKSTADNTLFGYKLFFSWNYLADYLFGLIVVLNMLSVFKLSEYISKYFENNKIFDWLYDKSRIVGNCTFTLYLFHTPLLFLFTSVLPYDRFNLMHVYSLIVLVCVVVYFIARVTEWKVDFWRNSFERVVLLFENGLGKIINIQNK